MKIQLYKTIGDWQDRHSVADKDAAPALGIYQSNLSLYKRAENRGVLQNERGEVIMVLPKHFGFYEGKR